jgi:hypothetical protein
MALFAAAHESGPGPKRRFTAARRGARNGGQTGRSAMAARTATPDPNETWRTLASRSAKLNHCTPFRPWREAVSARGAGRACGYIRLHPAVPINYFQQFLRSLPDIHGEARLGSQHQQVTNAKPVGFLEKGPWQILYESPVSVEQRLHSAHGSTLRRYRVSKFLLPVHAEPRWAPADAADCTRVGEARVGAPIRTPRFQLAFDQTAPSFARPLSSRARHNSRRDVVARPTRRPGRCKSVQRQKLGGVILFLWAPSGAPSEIRTRPQASARQMGLPRFCTKPAKYRA